MKYNQPQIYNEQKNGFWPKIAKLKKNWLWGIMAISTGGVVLEKSLRYPATPDSKCIYIAQGKSRDCLARAFIDSSYSIEFVQ